MLTAPSAASHQHDAPAMSQALKVGGKRTADRDEHGNMFNSYVIRNGISTGTNDPAEAKRWQAEEQARYKASKK